jgi:hypothetical protein
VTGATAMPSEKTDAFASISFEVKVARRWAEKAYVDGKRVGVWGWVSRPLPWLLNKTQTVAPVVAGPARVDTDYDVVEGGREVVLEVALELVGGSGRR